MKKLITLSLTAMMLSVLFCTSAIAKAPPEVHQISGLVAFSTDGYSRGVSYTDNQPLIQAQIDYYHDPTGLYAGIWGGNIAGDSAGWNEDWDYKEREGNVEIDIWVGYWTMVGPLELDLTATYLHFPRNLDAGLKADPNFDDWMVGEAEADYLELHIGLAHSFDLDFFLKLSVGYDFSPDYGGDGNMHHVNGVLEFGLPFEFTLALEAGYMNVEGDKQSGKDSSGYGYGLGYENDDGKAGYDWNYYRAGLSRDVFGFNWDLSYHFGHSEEKYIDAWYGTDDLAEDKLIITVTYAF